MELTWLSPLPGPVLATVLNTPENMAAFSYPRHYRLHLTEETQKSEGPRSRPHIQEVAEAGFKPSCV